MMFIVGCIGLGLNIISALFLHGECAPEPSTRQQVDELVEHAHGHLHGPPPTLEDAVTPIEEDGKDSIIQVCKPHAVC